MAAGTPKQAAPASKRSFKRLFQFAGHGLGLLFMLGLTAFALTQPELGYILPRELAFTFLVASAITGALGQILLVIGVAPDVAAMQNGLSALETRVDEDRRKALQRIEQNESLFHSSLGKAFEDLSAERDELLSRLSEIREKEDQAAADEVARLRKENTELQQMLKDYLRANPYLDVTLDQDEEEAVEAVKAA